MEYEYKYRIGTPEDKDKLQQLGLTSYGKFRNVLAEQDWNKMHSFLTEKNLYSDLLNKSKCFVCQTTNKEIIGMAYFISKGNPTDIFQTDWSYIRLVGVNPQGERGLEENLLKCALNLLKTQMKK